MPQLNIETIKAALPFCYPDFGPGDFSDRAAADLWALLTAERRNECLTRLAARPASAPPPVATKPIPKPIPEPVAAAAPPPAAGKGKPKQKKRGGLDGR